MASVVIAKQFLKLLDATTISVPVGNEDEFEFGIRKRESDKLRKLYLEKKGYKVIEMRECEWWDHVQENSLLKNHIRKNFPYNLPLSKRHC